MDLVEIFEVIFGAGFIILALIGSRQIFGGIFYSKKVKADVGLAVLGAWIMNLGINVIR